MRILVPSFDNEVYLSEFCLHLGKMCEVDKSYYNFWTLTGNYDIIHIHWPEYLFKWRVPTDTEFLLLEKTLKDWRGISRIVVTRHNYHPHYIDNEAFRKLYELVYSYADAVVHLGNFSKEEYKIRYKDMHFAERQLHEVIPHHIFTTYPDTVSSIESRKVLRIPEKAWVMLAFGRIQSADEKNLVINAFRSVKKPQKLLLAPGWRFTGEKEPVNRIAWFYVKHSRQYNIFLRNLPTEEVQYYFKSANLAIIPRVATLNSGLPFLCAAFFTPFIGPDTGNIREMCDLAKMQVFNPTVPQSLADTIKNANEMHFEKETFDELYDNCNSGKTMNLMLNLYKTLV